MRGIAPREVVLGPGLALLVGVFACGGRVTHDDSGPYSVAVGGYGAGASSGGSGGGAQGGDNTGAAGAQGPGTGHTCGCVVAIGLGVSGIANGCPQCTQAASHGRCNLAECLTGGCGEVLACLADGGYTEQALADCFSSVPPVDTGDNLPELFAWGSLECLCTVCSDVCSSPDPVPLCAD